MKLSQVTKESTMLDMIVAYKLNANIIGTLKVNRHLQQEFIKVLTIYPFNDKKLARFLLLNPYEKIGFMSRHITKVARMIGVPEIYIRKYLEIKDKYRKLRKKDKNAKTVIDSLHKETLYLCYAIFNMWDELHRHKMS